MNGANISRSIHEAESQYDECESCPREFWQRHRATFAAAEGAGLMAQETGLLRRELPTNRQEVLSSRTRVYLPKQTAARRGRVDYENATSNDHNTSNRRLSNDYIRE